MDEYMTGGPDTDGWTYYEPDPTCDHDWQSVTANRCECTLCDGYAFQG